MTDPIIDAAIRADLLDEVAQPPVAPGMKAADEIVRFVRKLIGWIGDRPRMYARTVGELDTVLHYLHLVWAESQGLLHEFYDALAEVDEPEARGVGGCFATDEQRTRLIESADDSLLRLVLARWKAVDDHLIKKGLMEPDYPQHDPQ